MEFIGSFDSLKTDYATKKILITFETTDKAIFNEVDKIKDINKLSIDVKKHRDKRGYNANAYLWVLLQKISIVLNVDKWDLYLLMLERYGVFTHIIVKKNMVDKVKNEWRAVKELGEICVNGTTGIQLQCYFGSSTYDTKEMSVLIDGVVSEAKELEIETLSPTEIERIKKQWGIEKTL